MNIAVWIGAFTRPRVAGEREPGDSGGTARTVIPLW